LIAKQENRAIILRREINQWTTKQLEKFLNFEHIRQHLIQVGLVCFYKNQSSDCKFFFNMV
jgi:hypothetical protein